MTQMKALWTMKRKIKVQRKSLRLRNHRLPLRMKIQRKSLHPKTRLRKCPTFLVSIQQFKNTLKKLWIEF